MNVAAWTEPSAHPRALPGGLAMPIAAAALLGALASSWVAAAGALVLWMVWALLFEPGEGLVLPVAVSFQWLQVTIGMYYFVFTGRRLQWIHHVETEAMVALGLGCVLALAVGLALGKRAFPRIHEIRPVDVGSSATLMPILVVYLVLLLMSDALVGFAWRIGGLTQLVLSLTLFRFVFFYMLVAKLARLPWAAMWVFLLFAAELAIGLSGYFASFRESFVIAFLAIAGSLRHLRTRHVGAFVVMVTLAIAVAWLWTGVKQDYRMEYASSSTRQERIMRMRALSDTWLGQRDGQLLSAGDKLVDRIWSVEYQAHALKRIPAVLPHEDGRLMLAALSHVFVPRAFFPDKPPPVHPSEMVRKYAGVWVAGEESAVSFAFGYAGESYVDFGVPVMFIPIFLFGILAGIAFGWMRRLIQDPLLRAATLTTLFWVSLYLYERAWARLLGLPITWFIGLGIVAVAVDRLWLKPRTEHP